MVSNACLKSVSARHVLVISLLSSSLLSVSACGTESLRQIDDRTPSDLADTQPCECPGGTCVDEVCIDDPLDENNDGAICTGLGDAFCDSGLCECARADCGVLRCSASDCLCGYADIRGKVCVGRLNDGLNGAHDCTEEYEACYDGECAEPILVADPPLVEDPAATCAGIALSAPTPTGFGTNTEPFFICTVEQFVGVAQLMTPSAHYALGIDLELGSSRLEVDAFRGHFDGGGHTLAYHMIASNAGVFGKQLIADSTIANVFVDVHVNQVLEPGNHTYAAIVTTNRGTIDGVHLSITAPPGTQAWHAGGITVWNTGFGTIRNCSVTGSMNTLSGSFTMLGGIAASNIGDATIDECTVSANLTTTAAGYSYVGGIAGYNTRATITNSSFEGSLVATGTGSSESWAGGIVAECEGAGTISGCASDGAFTASNAESHSKVGGVCASFKETIVTDSFSTGALSTDGSAGELAGIGVSTGALAHVERSYFAGVAPSGTSLGGNTRVASFAISDGPSCSAELMCVGPSETFQGKTHAVYASWDFDEVWRSGLGQLPTLR